MQYLLTEKEYNDLRQRAEQEPLVNMTEKKLQTLCTKIANTMPVTASWGVWKHTPTPWGCVLTKEDWYCDECPVQELCPSDRKSYSK